MIRRWVDVAWPLLLLVAFLVSFHYLQTAAAGSHSAVDCVAVADLDARALDECLAADAIDVELVAEAASRAASSGDATRAAALYRRALSLDPHDGELHLRLGELLLASGDRQQARREAEAAVAAEPGNPAAEALLLRAAPVSQ